MIKHNCQAIIRETKIEKTFKIQQQLQCFFIFDC